jgi:hypothetical protein
LEVDEDECFRHQFLETSTSPQISSTSSSLNRRSIVALPGGETVCCQLDPACFRQCHPAKPNWLHHFLHHPSFLNINVLSRHLAMTATFPYTLIACPCTSFTSPSDVNASSIEDPDDDTTFNPHHIRANFSLYPYEHLLYCDDCHQIRCPRCWAEEIMNWFCPSCLFEVPSSVVKSDGNR